VGPPDRRRADLAYAEMAHFTLVHEIAHGSDGVLDRHGRIDTMDVIEVDDIGFEALQAALAAHLLIAEIVAGAEAVETSACLNRGLGGRVKIVRSA
jgi:hypothetical protein